MGMDMYIMNNDEEIFYRGSNGWNVFSFFEKHGQVDKWSCDLYCELTKDVLKELIDVCCEVIVHPEKAEELLPTNRMTGYDNGYFRTLLDFVIEARRLLAETDFENDKLVLTANW